MKIFIAASIVLASAGLFTPASAQNAPTYRWCLMHAGPSDMAGAVLCRFDTLAQCMASRNTLGDTCYVNPEYYLRRR